MNKPHRTPIWVSIAGTQDYVGHRPTLDAAKTLALKTARANKGKEILVYDNNGTHIDTIVIFPGKEAK